MFNKILFHIKKFGCSFNKLLLFKKLYLQAAFYIL